jgi:hypothetical protein
VGGGVEGFKRLGLRRLWFRSLVLRSLGLRRLGQLPVVKNDQHS